VLDCHVRGGTLRYDVCGSWLVKLAESAEFNGVDPGADLRDEFDRVERLRGEPAGGPQGADGGPSTPADAHGRP
jgi:hypothetical protein